MSGDVTFLIGPTKQAIKGFKFPLMVSSQYFRTSFEKRWSINTSTSCEQDDVRNTVMTVIELPDLDPETFQDFINIMLKNQYNKNCLNEMNLTMDKIFEINGLADRFLVESLQNSCQQWLLTNLSIENVIKIYSGSCGILDDVKQKCLQYIKRNADAIISTQEAFHALPVERRREILELEDLEIDQGILFEVLYKKAKDAASSTFNNQKIRSTRPGSLSSSSEIPSSVVRKEFLDNFCLSSIKLMTFRFISTVVKPTGILTDSEIINLYEFIATLQAGSQVKNFYESNDKLKLSDDLIVPYKTTAYILNYGSKNISLVDMRHVAPAYRATTITSKFRLKKRCLNWWQSLRIHALGVVFPPKPAEPQGRWKYMVKVSVQDPLTKRQLLTPEYKEDYYIKSGTRGTTRYFSLDEPFLLTKDVVFIITVTGPEIQLCKLIPAQNGEIEVSLDGVETDSCITNFSYSVNGLNVLRS